MRKLIATLLIIFAGAIAARSQTINDYLVEAGNFTELRVKNSINVEYVFSEDSLGIATFSADSLTADALVFENRKGKLTISLEPRTYGRDHVIPTVTVRSNCLAYIANEGDSTVRATPRVAANSFKARLTGNGTLIVHDVRCEEVSAGIKFGGGSITISGLCDKASLSNTGSGSVIQAGELQADKIACNLMGTGTIDCAPQKELVVTGVGKGTVYYVGHPSIRNRAIGVKAVEVAAREDE